MPGTEGLRPSGMDVSSSAGEQQLVFTGRLADGTPGAFLLDGNRAASLAAGPGLSDLSGIVALPGGDVLVADTIGDSAIRRITAEGVEEVVAGLPLGYPAGLALAPGDAILLVSGQSADTGRATVYAVDLTTNMVEEIIHAAIAGNGEAGGLHRALSAPVFAWCGRTGPGGDLGGTVYRITLE